MVVSCPNCAKTFKASAALAGKRVKCPSCRNPFEIAAVPEKKPRAASAKAQVSVAENIVTGCPHCGKKFKVRRNFLGKKGKCPICKEVFTVTAAIAARQQVPPPKGQKTATAAPGAPKSSDKSGETRKSAALMIRPEDGLLSLMPVAEMKIKAGVAIWTMLTALMIIVHDLRAAMGIFHAAGAVAATVVVYAMGTYAFLSRDREWLGPDTQDRKKLRIFRRMEAMAKKAGLAVPQIALVEDDPDVNVVTYGMSTEAAKVVVSGPFMEHVKPSDEELDAVLAHELSHIRHGDFITSTLLRFPVWLLHKILFLVQIIRWIGTQCFAIFAQIAGAFGLIGLFMILGGIVVLVYLSITAAIIGAAILLCTLALSAFEREREYLADMYSARLIGSPKPLQGVLAKVEQASERVCKELEKRAEATKEGEQIDVNVEAPKEAFTSEGFVAKALHERPRMMRAFMRGEFFMSHPITEHRIFYLENPLERMRFFSNLWNKLAARANRRLGSSSSGPPALTAILASALVVGASLAALGRVQHWAIYAIAPAVVIVGAVILGCGARRQQWSGEQFVSGVVLGSFLSATMMFVLGILLLSPYSFYFPVVFVAALPINWVVGLLIARTSGSEESDEEQES